MVKNFGYVRISDKDQNVNPFTSTQLRLLNAC